jgi:hypothetical protein
MKEEDLLNEINEYPQINIHNPEFDKAHRAHDWRNYVSGEWKENWFSFSERERKIIAILYQRIADEEEWD